MANPKFRLGFREPDIDTNRPFTDGTVTIDGFDLECSNFRGPEHIDAWDASFGGLMTTKGKDEHPYVSIPAFPNRKFRLAYIFVNSAAGIETPKDLEGKRVAMFAWDNTAAIWSRGALKHHYGVDFTRINWFLPGADARSWGPDITVEPLSLGAGSRDEALDELLVKGEIDAVMGPNVLPSMSRKDPRLRRLFPGYRTEEQNYFTATGIFPISHVVSLNKDFVDEHPNAPVALLEAYRRARDVAFDRIYGSDPEIVTISWAADLMDEQRRVMGENYWAYNIEENARTLEAMMRFAHEFGITPGKLDYQSFFHPEAAALAGL
jgi:4,5-dihydroxyphthalate decarboxylase